MKTDAENRPLIARQQVRDLLEELKSGELTVDFAEQRIHFWVENQYLRTMDAVASQIGVMQRNLGIKVS